MPPFPIFKGAKAAEALPLRRKHGIIFAERRCSFPAYGRTRREEGEKNERSGEPAGSRRAEAAEHDAAGSHRAGDRGGGRRRAERAAHPALVRDRRPRRTPFRDLAAGRGGALAGLRRLRRDDRTRGAFLGRMDAHARARLHAAGRTGAHLPRVRLPRHRGDRRARAYIRRMGHPAGRDLHGRGRAAAQLRRVRAYGDAGHRTDRAHLRRGLAQRRLRALAGLL